MKICYKNILQNFARKESSILRNNVGSMSFKNNKMIVKVDRERRIKILGCNRSKQLLAELLIDYIWLEKHV